METVSAAISSSARVARAVATGGKLVGTCPGRRWASGLTGSTGQVGRQAPKGRDIPKEVCDHFHVTRPLGGLPIRNRDIHDQLSRLQRRHYVLASAHPNDADRFHVAPARGRLRDYSTKFGDLFALIIWKTPEKSPDVPFAFFVIPIARVRSELTDDRITRKDGSSWNAHVLRRGFFRTSERNDQEVDVRDCHGSGDLPQRVLAASLALPQEADALTAALGALALGMRR